MGDIIFKPHLGLADELEIVRRVNDERHYYNLINAINET